MRFLRPEQTMSSGFTILFNSKNISGKFCRQFCSFHLVTYDVIWAIIAFPYPKSFNSEKSGGRLSMTTNRLHLRYSNFTAEEMQHKFVLKFRKSFLRNVWKVVRKFQSVIST